jgi:hypothetical protein
MLFISHVTSILETWEHRERTSADKLCSLVYQGLRKLSAHHGGGLARVES